MKLKTINYLAETFTHEEKGGSYKIIGIHKMKYQNGEWEDAVMYRCLTNFVIYIRDLPTFEKKFKVTK